MSNDLSEKSKSYYEENNIYQKFSDAEDFLKLVERYLKPEVKDKVVLDLGCGNGKYIDLFKNITSQLYGVDLSANQLSLIKEHKHLICADASQLPFASQSMDMVYSCWMFGTILDEEKRLHAINEAKRVVKPGGKLILVENSNSGEFEQVRGRLNDPLNRTQKYNDWIASQNFIKVAELKTYFSFSTEKEANYIFKSIWKDRFEGPVKVEVMHDISVFQWIKN